MKKCKRKGKEEEEKFNLAIGKLKLTSTCCKWKMAHLHSVNFNSREIKIYNRSRIRFALYLSL